jgi:hypothetical protein
MSAYSHSGLKFGVTVRHSAAMAVLGLWAEVVSVRYCSPKPYYSRSDFARVYPSTPDFRQYTHCGVLLLLAIVAMYISDTLVRRV